MTEIEWFVGSNGNLFGDYNGNRYCVARDREQEQGYVIYRNGEPFGRVLTEAEATRVILDD